MQRWDKHLWKFILGSVEVKWKLYVYFGIFCFDFDFCYQVVKKATFENKVIQVLDHVQASVGLQYQWGNIMND